MKPRHALAAVLSASALVAAGPAAAQGAAAQFPGKAITIVIPATPGGAIDLTARVIAPKLTDTWGRPVVVENKAGATGIIGTEFIAKAAPDGHTLVLVASSHAINPSMFKKLPYDTVKSFEPVDADPRAAADAGGASVAAGEERPGADRVRQGQSREAQLRFQRAGGAPHMSGELFKSMTGIDMLHVPYKGSTAAHSDLLSGRTSVMFDTVTAINPHVKSGALRALAVTTAKRSAAAPDVPTMAEAGLKGYETSTWGGVLAPAGTPKDVVAKLNAEMNKALAAPDVRQRMLDAGIEPAGGTPQQFADFIQSEMMKWGKVAKTAGIQPE